MNAVLIRRARMTDWWRVYHVIETSWLWHYSKFIPIGALRPYAGRRLEHIIRRIAGRHGAFLAEQNGEPVAAMTLLRRPATIEVDDLFVLPGHTSHGIGKLLLDHGRREARCLGKPLMLWAMRDNCRARAFYEREGGQLFLFGFSRYHRGRFPSVAYRWPR